MDLYKNFAAHRYWCILSKYTVIFPSGLLKYKKFEGFEILIGSNIGSMNLFHLFQWARMELGLYLCYQLDFLLDFFTEDKSYQYLQDATSISFLSDKSAEILGSKYLIIWNLSILAAWQTHLCSLICKWGGSDIIIG